MNEEIRNRNNELSDAELESVSGGAREEDVQKVCKCCLSRRRPSGYSCTYEGGDWELLYERMISNQVVAPGASPHPDRCPYLKKL